MLTTATATLTYSSSAVSRFHSELEPFVTSGKLTGLLLLVHMHNMQPFERRNNGQNYAYNTQGFMQWHRYCVGNTAEENSSIFSKIQMC